MRLGATWSGGWINPLGSDYGWMYDDGPGGTNEDCLTAGSALCWAHRDIILVAFGSPSCGGGQAELAMGAGHVIQTAGWGESDTEVLAGVCGPAPPTRCSPGLRRRNCCTSGDATVPR